MISLIITGHVDDQHRLTADVPDTIPPGPITVRICPVSDEDEGGDAWMSGIAIEWADELSDSREDIYTLDDGEPVRES
jgi:hypothetical protein